MENKDHLSHRSSNPLQDSKEQGSQESQDNPPLPSAFLQAHDISPIASSSQNPSNHPSADSQHQDPQLEYYTRTCKESSQLWICRSLLQIEDFVKLFNNTEAIKTMRVADTFSREQNDGTARIKVQIGFKKQWTLKSIEHLYLGEDKRRLCNLGGQKEPIGDGENSLGQKVLEVNGPDVKSQDSKSKLKESNSKEDEIEDVDFIDAREESQVLEEKKSVTFQRKKKNDFGGYYDEPGRNLQGLSVEELNAEKERDREQRRMARKRNVSVGEQAGGVRNQNQILDDDVDVDGNIGDELEFSQIFAGLAGSKKEKNEQNQATNKQLTFFEQLMGQGKSGNEDDKQDKKRKYSDISQSQGERKMSQQLKKSQKEYFAPKEEKFVQKSEEEKESLLQKIQKSTKKFFTKSQGESEKK